MNNESKSLSGKFCMLRPVEEADAEFIVELRSDPKLSRHISRTDSSVEKQREWIRSYFERNCAGKEYYFIACDLPGVPWGTARLYHIQGDECTGGSWVMGHGTPMEVSLESYLLPMEFAFTILNLNVLHIDVRKGNKRVLQWHESCGAIFTHEDEENRYYDYTPAVYPTTKSRVYSLIQPGELKS